MARFDGRVTSAHLSRPDDFRPAVRRKKCGQGAGKKMWGKKIKPVLDLIFLPSIFLPAPIRANFAPTFFLRSMPAPIFLSGIFLSGSVFGGQKNLSRTKRV
jgi:hypothetical protein